MPTGQTWTGESKPDAATLAAVLAGKDPIAELREQLTTALARAEKAEADIARIHSALARGDHGPAGNAQCVIDGVLKVRVDLADAEQRLAATEAELAAAREERDTAWDCGEDTVCARAPGCNRHWEQRNRELVHERDAARAQCERLAEALRPFADAYRRAVANGAHVLPYIDISIGERASVALAAVSRPPGPAPRYVSGAEFLDTMHAAAPDAFADLDVNAMVEGLPPGPIDEPPPTSLRVDDSVVTELGVHATVIAVRGGKVKVRWDSEHWWDARHFRIDCQPPGPAREQSTRLSLLHQVARAADQLTDIMAEFDDQPHAWGEYIQSLDSAIERLKRDGWSKLQADGGPDGDLGKEPTDTAAHNLVRACTLCALTPDEAMGGACTAMTSSEHDHVPMTTEERARRYEAYYGRPLREQREASDGGAAANRNDTEKEKATTMTDHNQEHIEQFFAYEHLPPTLQEVSRPFGELARTIIATLPRNPERTVALRKLLEAKDAAVRASIAK